VHAGEWFRRAPFLRLLDQRRVVWGVVGPIKDAAQGIGAVIGHTAIVGDQLRLV
jgi:hypothetical protein